MTNDENEFSVAWLITGWLEKYASPTDSLLPVPPRAQTKTTPSARTLQATRLGQGRGGSPGRSPVRRRHASQAQATTAGPPRVMITGLCSNANSNSRSGDCQRTSGS